MKTWIELEESWVHGTMKDIYMFSNEEGDKIMQDICEDIQKEALKEAFEWINVKETLPNQGKDILIQYEIGAKIDSGFYDYNTFRKENRELIRETIHAWRYINYEDYIEHFKNK